MASALNWALGRSTGSSGDEGNDYKNDNPQQSDVAYWVKYSESEDSRAGAGVDSRKFMATPGDESFYHQPGAQPQPQGVNFPDPVAQHAQQQEAHYQQQQRFYQSSLQGMDGAAPGVMPKIDPYGRPKPKRMTNRDGLTRGTSTTRVMEDDEGDVGDYMLSDASSTESSINPKLRIKVSWFALLISSSYFLLSGFDGLMYCRTNHKDDEYYEKGYNKDGSASGRCIELFLRKIFVPWGTATLCSLFVLWELSKPRHGSVHLIGIPALTCCFATLYSLMELMLLSPPKEFQNINDNEDDTFSWGGNHDSNNLQKGQESLFFFQAKNLESSLYAINELGEIGANANLYHATWLSFFVSAMLSHQYLYPLFLLTCCKSYLFWKKHKLRRKFYFRHRERIGSWLTVFAACLVVLAASTLVWDSALQDECEYAIVHIHDKVDDDFDDDDYFNYEKQVRTKRKIPILAIHPRICKTAEAAMLLGGGGAVLALITMGIHASTHKKGNGAVANDLLLKLETFLVFVMVLTYGVGSIYITGSYQGGLAQNVGNLYYSSWIAFIFLIRVLIGCVEEITAGGVEEISPRAAAAARLKGIDPKQQASENAAAMENAADDAASIAESEAALALAKERKSDIKRWCAIALFSTIAHGSAFDSAQQYYWTNYGYFKDDEPRVVALYNALSPAQRWFVIAPCIVMTIASTVAISHLSAKGFSIISETIVGFFCALTVFGLCISQVVTAQHSENSFSMNHFGEVVSANLYYFAWASCVTCSVNFSVYVAKACKFKGKSYSFLLWFGLVKVGLIIMSSSAHLWHEIHDECEEISASDDDSDMGHSSGLCWRTKYSVKAGNFAFFISSIISVILIIKWKHAIYAQCIAAGFLVIFFIVGTVITTGMGGPAEKVGDLYYSTWLGFGFCLFLTADSLGQIRKLRKKENPSEAPSEGEEEGNPHEMQMAPSRTPYISMRA